MRDHSQLENDLQLLPQREVFHLRLAVTSDAGYFLIQLTQNNSWYICCVPKEADMGHSNDLCPSNRKMERHTDLQLSVISISNQQNRIPQNISSYSAWHIVDTISPIPGTSEYLVYRAMGSSGIGCSSAVFNIRRLS